MRKPKPPRPYEVRQKHKHYKQLLKHYEERKENNTFNKSGMGSQTYYERAIKRYVKYFEQWGSLIEVYINKPEN